MKATISINPLSKTFCRLIPLQLSFMRRLSSWRWLLLMGCRFFVFKDNKRRALRLVQPFLSSNEVYDDWDKDNTSNRHANCPVGTVVLATRYAVCNRLPRSRYLGLRWSSGWRKFWLSWTYRNRQFCSLKQNVRKRLFRSSLQVW